ncbi:MAG: leucyl/phenylalanyl-tRNA--protein transferase [Pseudomonadota bacterium]
MTADPPPLPWLPPAPVRFPDPRRAWVEPDGLLAAGGDLTPEWLITAYAHGIFPWFDDDEGPILWWSPDPRAVLEPQGLKVSKSLGKRLRNGGFRVTADQTFDAVIDACAAPRDGAAGTWITPRMRAAYRSLHRLGFAHSIEVWQERELAGGLYGVAVGRLFCGESMFSRARDASKVAFCVLARQLERWQFGLIDCQLPTAHLASLGAQPVPRARFLERIAELVDDGPDPGPWLLDPDLASPDGVS